jgi:hypothetical protein
MATSDTSGDYFDSNGTLRRAQLKRDRAAELRRIEQLDCKGAEEQGKTWYIVEAEFMTAWVAWVKGKPGKVAPTTIRNTMLLSQDDARTARAGLEIVTHYRRLNKEVWEAFVDMYGGGPAITVEDRAEGMDPFVGGAPNWQVCVPPH